MFFCTPWRKGGKNPQIISTFFEEINLMAKMDKVGLAQDLEYLLCREGQCDCCDPEKALLLKEAYTFIGAAGDLEPREVLAAYLRQ
jgi:hypothetical protein